MFGDREDTAPWIFPKLLRWFWTTAMVEVTRLKMEPLENCVMVSLHLLAWGFGLGQPYKITADGDCSHEIKRCLFLGRKAMTNLDSTLKSKGITLPTKVHIVKSMVFPVVTHGCESWTVKKAECWRIDAFELWRWRKLLSVPWTERRSNQSILKKSTVNIHWKDWNWSWSSSILVTWCKELIYKKRPWCWEKLKPIGEEGGRGWDR